ncbi:MAG: hypothetical protein H6738_18475 [Alphaproteobacteria bacterium]|nr:hypothetical protein [Alphaproteobacteria bacterium]
MRTAFLASWVMGCVAPPPENTALGASSSALFRDFDQAPESLAATVEQLEADLAPIDPTVDWKDRQVRLPPIQPDDRSDVAGTASDPADQTTVGLPGRSSHAVAELVTTLVEQDQVCINADAVGCHRRDATTDTACFVDGTCEDLRTHNVMLVRGSGVKVWLDFEVDFRRVELSDGRTAVVGRSWMPEEATSEGGGSHWNDRLAIDVFIPDPDDDSRTIRWYGTWTAVDLPLWIGEDIYRQALAEGIEGGFVNPDRFLDGEECTADIPKTCDFPG